MNEQAVNRDTTIEIDLKRLVDAVLKKAWVIVIFAIIVAIIVCATTFIFVTPKYEASAMFYVNNSAISVGDASLSISSGDLVTSRGLVDSYIVILNTRGTLLDVIDYADVDCSYSQLKSMIRASAVNETEIFSVVVESEDPNEAEKIANAIAYILPRRISSIIEGTSAKVVDAAVVPSHPSSPSYTMNTIIGFALGFIACAAYYVMKELFDITLRTEEDVARASNHPVLTAVPDMNASGKGSSHYSYGRYAGEEKKKGTAAAGDKLFGPGISFSATEAYKLLRTKLQFSFADDNNCRVIGLSSAFSGEGKSLTAVNLAYTLSQLEKKVALVDCDMRRPTLAEKLGLAKAPGLSNFLTGQSKLRELIQVVDMNNNGKSFHVISAGQNPPNPVELLSSKKMEQALEAMRDVYDYVILDLPPVGEVTDAMAVAKSTDGMLLVARQNYCNRLVLSDAVRQFEFIDARILGIVFNCTTENSGAYKKSYYKKGYYRKGYYRSSHYYRSSVYENNDRSIATGDVQEK